MPFCRSSGAFEHIDNEPTAHAMGYEYVAPCGAFKITVEDKSLKFTTHYFARPMIALKRSGYVAKD